MLRTHLLAWRCGSIMSGQRRACATMMPLSMLAASFGRPAASHLKFHMPSLARTGGCQELPVQAAIQAVHTVRLTGPLVGVVLVIL